MAAAALNLVYGYTGLLSFAQLGFWGIGGYATALTVVTFGGSFWSGLVWAALINAAVALAVGYPTLRTNRHAFEAVLRVDHARRGAEQILHRMDEDDRQAERDQDAALELVGLEAHQQ